MSCTIYSLLLVQVTNARMYLLCWLLLWSVGSLSFNILRLQSLQGRKANIALFSTSTTSTTSSSTLENKVQLPKVHTCPSCHDQFDSRNKLYKHLRQSEECVNKPGFPLTVVPETMRPRRISAALLVGYKADADGVAKTLEQYLMESEKSNMFERIFNNTRVSDKITITRASDASYRMSPSLQQSSDLAATADVLTFSYLSKDSHDSNDKRFSCNTIDGTRDWLDKINAALVPKGIHVFSRRNIDASEVFHAEQHCTVRIYDYVLPVRAVLPAGVDTWDNLDKNQKVEIQQSMKRAMKLLTSPMPADRGGYLWRKSKDQNDVREHHRWHNFCTGRLPPNDAAAGRTLDKFHVVFEEPKRDFVRTTKDGKQFILLRLQGDGFVVDQVRRMVGTMICLMYEYLPESYIPFVFDSMNIIGTPIAPKGLAYLKQARFGFHTHHRSLFVNMTTCSSLSLDQDIDADIDVDNESISYDPIREVVPSSVYARNLVKEMCLSDTASNVHIDTWLHDLRTTSEAIRAKMDMILQRRKKFKVLGVMNMSRLATPPPDAYENVLRLLRAADRSGNWPITSEARSKVIDKESIDIVSSGVDNNEVGGSFSVGKPVQGSTPRGNVVFGELLDAIFELEGIIAPHREPSTMVAINRRAGFKPHVDAGAGFGQSSSLIVGLGDYEGGELAVEDEEFDIKYKPLEFDGWRSRHWTLPFRGERFSLVYFTPSTTSSS